MLVIPFLVAALAAIVFGNPVLAVGFVCLAVCDYAGARA